MKRRRSKLKLEPGEAAWPLDTIEHARLSLLRMRRFYQEGGMTVSQYKNCKSRIYERWPELFPGNSSRIARVAKACYESVLRGMNADKDARFADWAKLTEARKERWRQVALDVLKAIRD